MLRKKWKLGLIIVLALIAVYFIFFRNTATPVKKVELQERKVQRTVSASGIVKSTKEADLSFVSTGNIYSINVEKGDEILKGQLLAVLDNYSDSQTLQSVRDARDIALRDRDLFIEQYETNKNAVGGKDEYAIMLRRQDEFVSKAEALYQAQIGLISKTYIYSPFEGTVIDIYKKEGETAALGEKVIKVADLGQLMFEIELDQEDYRYVKEDMGVDIRLDAYDNEIFKGKVVDLPKYVAGNADFTLEIKIAEEYSDKILLGMTGDAYIIIAETGENVPVLTFDEIFYDLDDKPYVYVEENGLAKKLYIDTGLQGDIYIEISSRIDNPIIAPQGDKITLEEGTPVKLIN